MIGVAAFQEVDGGGGEVDAHEEGGGEVVQEESDPSAGAAADVKDFGAVDGDFHVGEELVVEGIEDGVFDGAGIGEGVVVAGFFVELFPGLLVVIANVLLHHGHGRRLFVIGPLGFSAFIGGWGDFFIRGGRRRKPEIRNSNDESNSNVRMTKGDYSGYYLMS